MQISIMRCSTYLRFSSLRKLSCGSSFTGNNNRARGLSSVNMYLANREKGGWEKGERGRRRQERERGEREDERRDEDKEVSRHRDGGGKKERVGDRG